MTTSKPQNLPLNSASSKAKAAGILCFALASAGCPTMSGINQAQNYQVGHANLCARVTDRVNNVVLGIPGTATFQLQLFHVPTHQLLQLEGTTTLNSQGRGCAFLENKIPTGQRVVSRNCLARDFFNNCTEEAITTQATFDFQSLPSDIDVRAFTVTTPSGSTGRTVSGRITSIDGTNSNRVTLEAAFDFSDPNPPQSLFY